MGFPGLRRIECMALLRLAWRVLHSVAPFQTERMIMARRKKRSARRGKAAKPRAATRRAKTARKTAKKTARRSATKSKTRKKVAKTKRAVAKKAASKRLTPPKAAKPGPEMPIEVLEVETIEEVAPGVALVTDYEFIGVGGSSPSGPKKNDGSAGQ